jgi:Flp pilus assembly pilin Flp
MGRRKVFSRIDHLIECSRSEDGQTMTEYALVAGTISIAAVLVLAGISVVVSGQYDGVTAIFRSLLP